MTEVRPRLGIVGILLVIGFVLSGSVLADWNQWRGDGRNGVAAVSPELIEQLPDDGLSPVWVSQPIQSAGDGGWGSPVVAGGKVYLFAHVKEKLRELGEKQFPWLPPDRRVGMSDEEYEEYEIQRRNEDEDRASAFAFREFIYCLDGETGEEVWTSRSDSVYTRFPQSGSPTVLDGKLYILGAGRYVRCLDAKTGDDLWRTLLPGEFRDEFMQSSVAVADGVAVVMADHLFGLDIVSGDIVWEGDPDVTRGTHSSPVLWDAGGRTFVILNLRGGWTGCIDPRSGHELWRVESESGHATPVVTGDRLITYGDSRSKGVRCFAIDEEGAEELWRYRGLQDKGSSPLVVNGYVYVQGETRVACVDLDSGEAAWTDYMDLNKAQYSSPIAADGKVFYAFGTVLCFRATPGEFQPLYDARFDESHLMGSEESFRRLLNLEGVAADEAEQQMQRHVGRHGTLQCSSPAISDGRLYVRMRNALVCYDLRR